MVGSRLSHPNIVRYNEMETTDEGVFMILDYVEGRTLTEILNTKPEYFSDEEHLRRFCLEFLSGLEYLHSQQILHLDLKPDNIMITRVNEDVKILDLGFCRTDCYTDSEGKTIGYEAPEQGDKNGSVVDSRTDLYAFGRILEKIEHHQPQKGYKLPAVYEKMKEDCLQSDPNKRPQHASDCIRRINVNRFGWGKKLILGLLMVVVLSLGLAFLYEPSRNDLMYSFRDFNFRGYHWIDQSCKFRLLSAADQTCQIVGWDTLTDLNHIVVIPSRSTNWDKDFSVTSIADSAFCNHTEIVSLFLPEGLESIGIKAFENCRKIPILNMPNTVKHLGKDCFHECKSLRSLHLSNSLTELPPRAFHDCPLLEVVSIPEGVQIIREDCFVADTTLVKVDLPSTLTAIERGVFYGCSKLQQVTLPASLQKLGEYSFYHCDSLKDLVCLAEIPPESMQPFNRTDIRVHVPSGSVGAYREHPEWRKYEIIGLDK